MEWKRMKDYFPDLTSDYFFTSLVQSCNLPFDVDMLAKYYFAKSYERIASPITRMYSSDNSRLSAFLVGTFKKKWEQALQVYTLEYAPAENYDRKEDSIITVDGTLGRERGTKDTRTEKLSGIVGSSQDYGHSITDIVSGNESNTNNRYGINSTGAHPDTSSSGTSSATDTTTHGGTDSTHSESSSDNKITTAYSGKDTDTNHEKTVTDSRIHGNIGVTTTQQMLQSDLELWKWIFMDDIVKDINSVLTLHIY